MHKRLMSTIHRRGSQENGIRAGSSPDSPEASAARGVRLFCESGGPNNSGEEVLHLPTIVDAAESSPAAATESARLIRKFLSIENQNRAYVQYNAVMLMRILADNPGQSFTKNVDAKFVNTVKELLREGRDMSVQQILRETLDNFEATKLTDENLLKLMEVWRKEKAKMNRLSAVPPPPVNYGPPGNFVHQQAQQQNYFSRPHRSRNTLPPPAELAQRIEEARTSAKLLSQVVGTTPPGEVIGNELIKEFVERCQSASRSVQAYIHADNPPPDEDTLLTLIETNDQLATAMSRYQRALLEARKRAGIAAASPTPSPNPPPPNAFGNDNNSNYFTNRSHSAGNQRGGLFDSQPTTTTDFIAPPPPGPPPGRKPVGSGVGAAKPDESQNPFGDQNEAAHPGTADLQAPLQPQVYGLPPQGLVGQAVSDGPQVQAPSQSQIGVANGHQPQAGTTRGTPDIESPPPQQQQQQAQPVKPRYRF